MGHLYAGTSGFAYPKWKPDFYPAKLPAKDFLKHYATKLNASRSTTLFDSCLRQPRSKAGSAPRPRASHRAQSSHADHAHLAVEGIRVSPSCFSRAIDPLRATRRLGPVLFQLPPNLKADFATLEAFLARLSGGISGAPSSFATTPG